MQYYGYPEQSLIDDMKLVFMQEQGDHVTI